MQYMLLIYNDEAAWQGLSETELNGITNEYFAFTDSIRESGNFVTGAPLQPTTMSTSVRVRDGEQLVTDGPFAETKEQLGRCYRLSSKAGLEPVTWVRSRFGGSSGFSSRHRSVVLQPNQRSAFPGFTPLRAASVSD